MTTPIRKPGGYITTATERMTAARSVKQDAITRELLLAAVLSRVWPSYLMPPKAPQANYPLVVCIQSPAGPLCWRLRDDELPLFAHLERRENDGQDYHGGDKLVALLHLATEGW